MNLAIGLAAARYGAAVANYTEVVRLLKTTDPESGREKVCGARCRDVLTGASLSSRRPSSSSRSVIIILFFFSPSSSSSPLSSTSFFSSSTPSHPLLFFLLLNFTILVSVLFQVTSLTCGPSVSSTPQGPSLIH